MVTETKFKTWINKFGGADRLAVKLNMSSFAVRHWLYRHGSPRIAVIRELVKLSKGELTADDIIEATQKKQ